jgi:multiple antibiotic resistance protein
MSLINTAVGLLAISSPIGLLPVVMEAGGGNPVRIRRISRLAVLTFLLALIAACWWGPGLLDLFGITLEAFRVAGGLILLPIGLPLLAGPGAISLVVADAPAAWQGRLALSGVIGLLAIVIYLVLIASMPLRQALGELQEKVISRLMGLLLSAIAVQMLVSGLRGCFPVLA